MSYTFSDLLESIRIPEKRKIFISYHHDEDQGFYNSISKALETEFTPVQDNSLDRLIDSDDPEYVMQRIRDNHISGTSCTIVLCGSETPYRKYVDWEIKGTLDKDHGLIGIALPTCRRGVQNKWIVPERLHDNISSGYATFIEWASVFNSGLGLLYSNPAATLKAHIEAVVLRNCSLIDNSREKMGRNKSSTFF